MDDEKGILISLAIFAAGAVAVILYQHSQHTGQVIAALNASAPASATPVANAVAVAPASTAGLPIIGQANLQMVPQPSPPMQINAGYTVH